MHFLRNSIGLHTNGQTLFPDQIITGRECLPYKKHAALGTSACATSSKTVCRIGLWRRHSCVCPKGADYQWGKDPLEQLMVRFDSYRAARLGNQASRKLVKKSTLGGRATWQAVTRVK